MVESSGPQERSEGNWYRGDAKTAIQVNSLRGDIRFGETRPAPRAPRQLPLDVPGFVNREADLRALDDLLAAATSEDSVVAPAAVVVSAIAGAPGVGKTALAVHWAHRCRERFPDGDLYVDMRGYGPGRPLTADDALSGFLRALGVPAEAIPDEVGQRAALYRSILDGRDVLVVIDNAVSAAAVRPLLPASSGCFAVITSRSRLAGLVTREGARRVTLDILSPEGSVELIGQVIGPERAAAEPEAARRLAELCGYLPIALRVVAEHAASRPALSLHGLLDELVDEKHRLDALTEREDELSDVRTVFSWSYRALDPTLQRAFRLLSLHPSAEFGIGAAAALTGTDERTAARQLRELTGAHLLQEPADGRFRLHDLLRAYAGECARAEESQQARTQAIRRMLSWYLHALDYGRRAILPHSHEVALVPAEGLAVPEFAGAAEAMGWFERERTNLLAALRQAFELGQYDIAWKLPVVADGFFELGSYWSEWEQIHRQGLDAARALGDVLGEASNLFCLGDAAWRGGRYEEAAENYRRTIELAQGLHDTWLEGFALRGLGLIRQEQGELTEATALFGEALEVFRGAGWRRGEGMALLSLSRSADTDGDLERAAELAEQASRTFQELPDEWSVAWAALSLGPALRKLGRTGEAEAQLRQAIDIFVRHADRRSQAMAWEALAEVFDQTGNTSDARQSWRTAAELYEVLRDDKAAELQTRAVQPPDPQNE
ncbi:tetratricopeptide repeat protein [Actinomadura rupiterrae]|uniref:tetratricopeptide repeat protein n=1 Tax=Actinomadura rupiterrae TaxID=559627 RepID=UPI0020A2EE95|nr:tetratricopeptide repeat protein [Actinomadura rupiterrae]MCP2342020.1 tetratricopeptide (TPR) repeat protein [Actinomadura rupiterrae]